MSWRFGPLPVHGHLWDLLRFVIPKRGSFPAEGAHYGSPRLIFQSIVFLQAFVANCSICFVPTGPLVDSSSNASTTASPTTSTFSGFSAMDPRNPSLLPRKLLNSAATNPPRAIGSVNFLLESYMKPGRIKMLRSSGSEDEIVASASRLVVMYRAGRIGAPAAAEMYTKAGTCSFEDSCASAMAVLQFGISIQANLQSPASSPIKGIVNTGISVHQFISQLSIPLLWLESFALLSL